MLAQRLAHTVLVKMELAGESPDDRVQDAVARSRPVKQHVDALWPTIPAQRFQEVDKAFGQWEMSIYALFLYVVDNEIHHRGQGYVYLRSLGIEPPPFYERP